MKIAIVTGLPREARIAAGAGLDVACRGPGPDGARQAAGELAARGADWLVSFGYAGGLSPDLAAGDLVVPTAVLDQAGRRWTCAGLPGFPMAGLLLGADRVMASRAEKGGSAGLAAAVDCESHAVAAVASARGIGFSVVRVVVDAAGMALPAASLVAVDRSGRLRPAALLAALLRRPGDLPGLLRLAAASRSADRTLTVAALRLARLG
ncbi:adenosylhomocysteine nucleosidase [Stella humosa]|uniref:Adenosylhomocysteine nucleosidase n=1 Tax=Stella humosa TaxID=94 RepID=A0A3N1KVA0_9PROT|nr:hypothetical protein [Stella humosa]ROP81255.1 adenosylhomocysteine nucleosidase [Stella humosa]BBK32603.1 hypothetical protein STHU_32370 [Stella humosa]